MNDPSEPLSSSLSFRSLNKTFEMKFAMPHRLALVFMGFFIKEIALSWKCESWNHSSMLLEISPNKATGLSFKLMILFAPVPSNFHCSR